MSLKLTLGGSRRLGAILGIGHLGALAVAGAALPAALAVPTAAAIVLSGWDAWRTHVSRRGGTAIRELVLEDRTATLTRRDGVCITGRLIGGFVNPLAVVLTIRRPGHWRVIPLVILPDAVGDQAHRGLRVWLKWKRDPVDNPAGM